MKPPKSYIKPLARAGYASRGVVYLIIGAFATLAAIGSGENRDTEGALQELLSQPFGYLLVGLLIVGLTGYVIWRLIQAITDADDHGRSAKGLAIRGALLVSAFTYAALALYAMSQVGLFSGGSGSGSGGTIAGTMSGIVGARPVAVGLAAIFLTVGIAHCWKAVTEKFEAYFVAREETLKVLRPVAKIGLIARGIVFLILAFLLFYRGFGGGSNGSETPDIKDALEFLTSLPMGHVLLALMGVGIILFAVYSFCEALWRRVRLADPI